MVMKMMKGSTKPMNQVEISWLAGIIDGEGSFSKTNATKRKTVEVRVKSIDLDIVERCRDFSGMGNILGPYYEESRQPIYIWRVSKRRDVFRLFLAIAPLISSRRKARILELANEVFG